jgi:nucleoside-diphosphate-sugar epimerase
MKEHILITGAAGFLGSVVTRKLIEKGCKVTALIRPTTDLWRIEKIKHKIQFVYETEIFGSQYFQRKCITSIVHGATNYGRNKETLPEVVNSNLGLPLKLLELSYRQGVRRFINCDSFLNKDGKPYLAAFPYSLSKLQFLIWFQHFSTKNKGLYFNLIFEHIYGENDSSHKFIPFLIKSMREQVSKIPLTSCLVERDFIHVEDAAEAIMVVIMHRMKCNYKVVNLGVGCGQYIMLRNIVEMLAKKLKFNGELQFEALKMRDGEIKKSNADLKSWKKIGLYWAPKYNIEEGLNRVIASYF